MSILKPVCGLDDELEENLLSFLGLTGIDYEIIVSIEDAADPALPTVQRVAALRPDLVEVVVGGGKGMKGIFNRKVERLVAAEERARGEILFISDSNVRVEPAQTAQTIALFEDPQVGCVSNLFTGAEAESFGARLESFHLLSFVVPGCVLAAAAQVPCVVGKSMALRRRALASVGGFAAFRSVLAEDQSLGLELKKSGWKVLLSPTVVRNVILRRTISQALGRQIRWGKIRYAFSRATYAAELVLFPLAWSLLLIPLTFTSTIAWNVALLVLASVTALRMAQVAVLGRAVDTPLRWSTLVCVPLFDILQFGAHFVPFFSDEVHWRGRRMRVSSNTRLIANETIERF